jgi:hypothetical protein
VTEDLSDTFVRFIAFSLDGILGAWGFVEGRYNAWIPGCPTMAIRVQRRYARVAGVRRHCRYWRGVRCDIWWVCATFRGTGPQSRRCVVRCQEWACWGMRGKGVGSLAATLGYLTRQSSRPRAEVQRHVIDFAPPTSHEAGVVGLQNNPKDAHDSEGSIARNTEKEERSHRN